MLTAAEAIAASLAVVPAAIVISAYLLDRAGASFTPAVMLVAACAAGLVAVATTWRRAARDAAGSRRDLGVWLLAVSATLGWLVWRARPTFFPLGSGPDLTHHLLLIQYIEQHWQLVHQAGVEDYLGEMVHYTPGSHILAALAGAWTRSTGLHVLHTVLAATVALKVGFVWLIARRSVARVSSTEADSRPSTVATATTAAVALLASPTFFLGSFIEFSFVAQVVAECFVVAAWWSLTAWDDGAGWETMLLAGMYGAAAFLTWPILVGPLLILLGCLVLLPGRRRLTLRLAPAFLVVAPVAVVAALFIAGRVRMMVIAGAGGAAVWPRVHLYGWWFLVASTAGLMWAGTRLLPRPESIGDASRDPIERCARTTFLFVVAILMQTAALYVFATVNGNVPYMASKMFYLLLYPQAVGVAFAARALVGALRRTAPPLVPAATASTMYLVVLAAVVALVARTPADRTYRAFGGRAATSRPLEQAGLWARAHLPRSCVEYLVPDHETAYWLHLAVLGNPRSGARTADNATYDQSSTLVRWLTPGGLPYAVADLPSLPSDVRADLDVLQTFDTAAVVRRRGPTSCAEPTPASTAAGPARR